MNYSTFETVYDRIIRQAILDKATFTKEQIVEKLIYQCGFAKWFANDVSDRVMIELAKIKRG